MWPFSYFRRKSEERRKKIKEELLAELLPVIEARKDDLVKSTRKDISSAVNEFNDAIDKKKKGLEDQVKELRNDVHRYESKSRSAVDAAREVKKNSERLTAVANDAKKEADVVVDSIKTMEEIVKKAENLYTAIDAKLDEYTGIAVKQCTEVVAAEMHKAVVAAREEYELNKEELPEFVDRKNAARMNEWFAEINKKADELIQKINADCAEAVEKRQYAVQQIESVVADKQYIINALNYMRRNLPVVAYALQLSDLQKRLLRELFNNKYAGDLGRLRRDLDEKSKLIEGKRELAPEELDIKFGKRELNEMVRNVKTYNLGNLSNLLEAVDVLTGVYKGRDR